MPGKDVSIRVQLVEFAAELTRVFGVLWADILVACIQDVLVHERRARCNLSEERHLDRLSDLDSLALLHENLSGVLATVLAVEGRHAVLLWVVAFLERLQGGHEVMSSGDTRRDDALGDTSGHGSLDNCGHGIHGSNNLVLELRWNVQFDLLEQVF